MFLYSFKSRVPFDIPFHLQCQNELSTLATLFALPVLYIFEKYSCNSNEGAAQRMTIVEVKLKMMFTRISLVFDL